MKPRAIDSKWVFALKKNEKGNIERFKARDFELTIRLVMALAVQWKMHLHQIDISSAYLNSNIQHDIYVRQAREFVDCRNPDKVLKLHKAIYGLKQSGKEWN